jgi:hypothetical protein
MNRLALLNAKIEFFDKLLDQLKPNIPYQTLIEHCITESEINLQENEDLGILIDKIIRKIPYEDLQAYCHKQIDKLKEEINKLNK